MADRTPPTERTRVRRIPERGYYDAASINPILDEALVCHVAFVHDGQPVSIPAVHGRIGSDLYLHGSVASRMQRSLAEGIPVAVSVAIVDGFVIGRSILSHSMNYRSVVLFGVAEAVSDEEEKRAALIAITNFILPDRWDAIREPTEAEWAQTHVLRIPLAEASAKIRTGPPIEETEEDYELDAWAGVIPLRIAASVPVPGPRQEPTAPVPPDVTGVVERYP
ncbi:MAG: pyridoxamine 5'-phosphate oxidase family protein [Actinomycetia bacterium]|nr:pyridoxamine 5'-phosphate oxidase family protein [Actinomycetes bacterium]MCP4224903.1 pyridoxamine 5'-phosphate oxidase family protein [Actinomycetes bacterium]MCP5031052.1 pyridoxamine 5'-phosphate oxidase family protein [Actinomycetes bacterium]